MVHKKIKLDFNVQNYFFWALNYPPTSEETHNQHWLKLRKKNGKNKQNTNFHKGRKVIGPKQNF
jgi:hypothetical protein